MFAVKPLTTYFLIHTTLTQSTELKENMKRTKDNIFELTNMLEAIRTSDLLETDPISPETDDKYVTPPESENPSLTASLIIGDTNTLEPKALHSPSQNEAHVCEESNTIPSIDSLNSLQSNIEKDDHTAMEHIQSEDSQLPAENSDKEEPSAPVSNLLCSHSGCDEVCKLAFYTQNPAKPKKILGIKNKSKRKKKVIDSDTKNQDDTKLDIETVKTHKAVDVIHCEGEKKLNNLSDVESGKDDFSYEVEFSESVFWSVPVEPIIELTLSETISPVENDSLFRGNILQIEQGVKSDEITLVQETVVMPPSVDTNTTSQEIDVELVLKNEEKTDTNDNEPVSNDNYQTHNIEPSVQHPRNHDKNDFIVEMVNAIVDAASNEIKEVENDDITGKKVKDEFEYVADEQNPPLIKELAPIRQRKPSSASSDGRISRKISYEDGSTGDPIDIALNELRLSVTEFCDICLQELHGL